MLELHCTALQNKTCGQCIADAAQVPLHHFVCIQTHHHAQSWSSSNRHNDLLSADKPRVTACMPKSCIVATLLVPCMLNLSLCPEPAGDHKAALHSEAFLAAAREE